jgi:multidrug efflux pump subunit AcrB
MVSMFAYIIALGIVVDDAIVIGENIYYHHQNGKPFLTAAIYGAKELCVPVTFSILTNIVTFLPLLFLPGIMGKIFKTVPIVVCTVFLISLIESIFILPAHLSHQKEKKRRGIFLKFHTFQQKFSTWFISSVEKYFKPFLAFVLIRRYIAILIGMCILIFFIVYAVTGRMGFSMFPLVESDYSQMELTLPYGVDFEKTKSISKSIYIAAQKTLNEMNISKYVEGIVSEIGKDGGHTARIQVHFVGTSERKKSMSIFDFTNAWRKNAGVITGIDSINFASNAGGPGHGSDITIEISHRNISVLRKVSNELVNALENYSIVKDINDGYQLGKEQLDFKIKPEAKNLGLTATTIARQIRNSFYGSEVLRQQRGRNEIKIMVRLPKKERISEGNLENLLINTPYNTKVPLTEIVDIIRGRAYTEIKRRNNRRIIQVTASVTKKDRTNEILSDLSQKILPKLTEKYPNLIYSFEGKSADSRESMHSLKVGFTLALLGVFSLLAIPFKSYSQPLIIMISIPFGVIGAILGHMLMGYSLSVVGILGIVALSGVVVNDALVLIDASNRYVNSGLSYFQAVLEAAVQRFRPILLTTLTTFFGLVPMIFETDRAARFLIPMAISLGFGILFATFITLLLVPCLFIVFKDISILIDKYKCILNKFFNY